MTQQRPPKRQNRPLALIHARLVDPAGKRDETGGILVEDGIIREIGPQVSRGHVPEEAEIVDCAGHFGMTSLFGAEIPICGLAGDQQSATIGQACLAQGETKATYGTGAFVLTNAGTAPPSSKNRLLATVLW